MSFAAVGIPCSGGEPPPHLPRHLLFRVLAYRLQADQLGDLDAESLRSARSLGIARECRHSVPVEHRVSTAEREARDHPGPGMEWADAPGGGACPMALPGTARPIASLSKVAFAITGTRWNGPRFFGLRDKPSKEVRS